jgi:hypothetical protein
MPSLLAEQHKTNMPVERSHYEHTTANTLGLTFMREAVIYQQTIVSSRVCVITLLLLRNVLLQRRSDHHRKDRICYSRL